MIVFDFPSINRKLNCQEQKAEFEAKHPKSEPPVYWPMYGVGVGGIAPFIAPDRDPA